METIENLTYLSKRELAQIEGGSWLSYAIGYSYEAIKYYGGKAVDFLLSGDPAANETLMNCI